MKIKFEAWQAFKHNTIGRFTGFLKSKIRLFWNGLWIRKDEFHSSLDMDGEAMMHMNGKQRDRYMKDLVRRRNIAHERDMKKKFR